MRSIIIGVGLLLALTAESKQLKVAIIDTGIKNFSLPGLCESGHRDFTRTNIIDINGHGTNVAGLIYRNSDKNYCAVIIKYWTYGASTKENISRLLEALEYAISLKVDIINLSGGGHVPIEEEEAIVKKALNKGITMITAAGNNKINLDKGCNYFPACYDERIIVIGNKHHSSNFGKVVDFYVDGVNKEGFGITLTGTSQSTAIYTGRHIKRLNGLDRNKTRKAKPR